MSPLREVATGGPQSLTLRCCLLFLQQPARLDQCSPLLQGNLCNVVLSLPCQASEGLSHSQDSLSPLLCPAQPLLSRKHHAQELHFTQLLRSHVFSESCTLTCSTLQICRVPSVLGGGCLLEGPKVLPESPLFLGTHRTQWAEEESFPSVRYIAF